MATIFDNKITLKISEVEANYLLGLIENDIVNSKTIDYIRLHYSLYERMGKQIEPQRLCNKREKENKYKDTPDTCTWDTTDNGTLGR